MSTETPALTLDDVAEERTNIADMFGANVDNPVRAKAMALCDAAELGLRLRAIIEAQPGLPGHTAVFRAERDMAAARKVTT